MLCWTRVGVNTTINAGGASDTNCVLLGGLYI
jgi:hypothetical protein